MAKTLWDELSFLALPDEVIDWRKALLYEVAADAGILARLPGSAVDLGADLDLDPRAVRVALDALAVWNVVEAGGDGVYRWGRDAPDAAASAVMRHHGRAIRHWATSLPDRLRGADPPRRRMDPRAVEIMLEALVVNARESAPGAVDACLAHLPEARRVLDLGGGHGEYALEFARRGLAATMQDRPEVVGMAGDPHPLTGAGVEVFAGDFFEALPDGPFDIIFCAGVTYTMGADANLTLYRRVRPLIAGGGALAVLSFLGGTDDLASIFSVQMLSGGGGGESHRESHYRAWLAEAGYASVSVQRLERRPEWLVVARP